MHANIYIKTGKPTMCFTCLYVHKMPLEVHLCSQLFFSVDWYLGCLGQELEWDININFTHSDVGELFHSSNISLITNVV